MLIQYSISTYKCICIKKHSIKRYNKNIAKTFELGHCFKVFFVSSCLVVSTVTMLRTGIPLTSTSYYPKYCQQPEHLGYITYRNHPIIYPRIFMLHVCLKKK